MCSNFCHVLKNIRINNQDVPAILAHPDFIVELAVANLQGRCFSELGCGSREFAYHGYQHLEALLGFYGVVRSGRDNETFACLDAVVGAFNVEKHLPVYYLNKSIERCGMFRQPLPHIEAEEGNGATRGVDEFFAHHTAVGIAWIQQYSFCLQFK